MARYPLNLPAQLKQGAEEWAARQGISLNQFIMWAVAEKVGLLSHSLDKLLRLGDSLKNDSGISRDTDPGVAGRHQTNTHRTISQDGERRRGFRRECWRYLQ